MVEIRYFPFGARPIFRGYGLLVLGSGKTSGSTETSAVRLSNQLWLFLFQAREAAMAAGANAEEVAAARDGLDDLMPLQKWKIPAYLVTSTPPKN